MNLFLSDQEFSRMHRMRFPETGRKSFFWRRVRYRLKLSNTLQHAATLTEKGQQRQLDIAPPNCECKHPSSEPPHAHFRTDRARARTRLTPVPARLKLATRRPQPATSPRRQPAQQLTRQPVPGLTAKPSYPRKLKPTTPPATVPCVATASSTKGKIAMMACCRMTDRV